MSQQDKLSVKIALILALLIYGLSLLYLASFLHLSQVNGATVMVLATFVASVLLWIFVATDWSSLLAILALGLIPQVGVAKAASLSLGSTTFAFLFFTFIVTYALSQMTLLKRFT